MRTGLRRTVPGGAPLERLAGPVLTLAAGSALAQAIAFAARPALTRLYTPEEFGLLTLFVTGTALAAAVGTGRYEDALAIAPTSGRAAALGALAAGLGLATALAAGAATGLAAAVGLVPAGGLGAVALGTLAAGGVGLTALTSVTARWLARCDRFDRVAAGRLVQATATVGLQLAAGAWTAGAGGLVGGAVLGSGAGAALLTRATVRSDPPAWRRALRPAVLRALVRRYARFPRFGAPATLLKGLAGRAAVFALAPFGSATVGLYGVAYATVALPLDLAAHAAGEVFLARGAGAARSGTLADLAARTFERVARWAAYPCLVVIVAGPALFGVVFGAAWQEAGQIARIVAPWIGLTAVAVPLTGVFDVLERQREDLLLAAAALLAQIGGAVAGGLAGGPFGAVAGVAVGGTAFRLLHLRRMLRLAGVPVLNAVRAAGRAVAVAALAAAPTAAAYGLGLPPAVQLVLAVLGGVGYAAWALRAPRP